MKHLLKVSHLFVALLLSTLILTSCNQTSKPDEKFTGSLLWKISGKNLSKPSYIFGTHHLTSVNFLDSVVGLDDARKNTNRVIGEITFDQQAELMQKVQEIAMFTEGEGYNTLLSEGQCKQLDENLKLAVGAGLAQLGKMKPTLVRLMLVSSLQAKVDPTWNLIGHITIDQFLQDEAKKKNKGVFALETVEVQIDMLFNTKSQKEQAEDLICSTSPESVTYQTEALKSMFKNYKKGALADIYKEGFNNPADPCPAPSQEYIDILLKNRNNNWLKQLPSLFEEEPSLVAIGALHLAGEEGLLYQLDQMGYTVEAVK